MKSTPSSNTDTARPTIDPLVERGISADEQIRWAHNAINEAINEVGEVCASDGDMHVYDSACTIIIQLRPQLLLATALARSFSPHLSLYEAMKIIQNRK